MTFQVYSKAELIEKIEQAQFEIARLNKELAISKNQAKLIVNKSVLDAETIKELVIQRNDLIDSLKFHNPEAFDCK